MSLLLATLLLCGVLGPGLGRAHETPCAPVAIGIDTSHADNSAGAVLGESPGQTFFAADTLLHSLTVWRVASQWNSSIGMHLFITETDSTGRPDLGRVVLDGPTIVRTDGDGVNPTPFHWHFDPPLALPGAGTYAFFLAQNPCFVYFDILTTAEDTQLYPGGIVWVTGRGACDMSSGWARPFPRGDLIFQIEFCQTDTTTQARPGSWGDLKVIYRKPDY